MIFQIFKGEKGQWYWRLKTPNGNSIAISGEGYHNKADCLRGIEIIKSLSTQKAPVFDKNGDALLDEVVIDAKGNGDTLTGPAGEDL